ncbi:uncharacterized protein LOC108601702 [Drosophila busckii]|uniref:uncharacterized protein LOC108601702 n=1 Tax=Drosophila busckii TaxID=30019 RepID=UPI00083F2127|nr:uncharacterized protein LOC108601702 [Drosophila busckii]
MGSIEKACISGFLCRLCSEMHRTVIHIYGDHGQRLCLVEKINGYLPITISPTDPLPKTICKTCLHRVEQHYILLMRLARLREERKYNMLAYKKRDEAENSPISSVECSDEEDTDSTGNVAQTLNAARRKSTRNNLKKETSTVSNRNNLDQTDTRNSQNINNISNTQSSTGQASEEYSQMA